MKVIRFKKRKGKVIETTVINTEVAHMLGKFVKQYKPSKVKRIKSN